MPLVVHHLHVSQSERIPWLCEELGVDYELKTYTRAPYLAPPEYKALHPLGTAPVIQDGDLTLAESCAIIEYISHRYADGKLFVPPSHPQYAEFLFWWHFANSSFQPTTGRTLGLDPDSPMFKVFDGRRNQALQLLNDRLARSPYLAGDALSAADIVIVFSLTTMRYFSAYSLAGYDHILAYLRRIAARPAFQAAKKKADPDLGLALDAEPPKPFAPAKI